MVGEILANRMGDRGTDDCCCRDGRYNVMGKVVGTAATRMDLARKTIAEDLFEIREILGHTATKSDIVNLKQHMDSKFDTVMAAIQCRTES